MTFEINKVAAGGGQTSAAEAAERRQGQAADPASIFKCAHGFHLDRPFENAEECPDNPGFFGVSLGEKPESLPSGNYDYGITFELVDTGEVNEEGRHVLKPEPVATFVVDIKGEAPVDLGPPLPPPAVPEPPQPPAPIAYNDIVCDEHEIHDNHPFPTAEECPDNPGLWGVPKEKPAPEPTHDPNCQCPCECCNPSELKPTPTPAPAPEMKPVPEPTPEKTPEIAQKTATITVDGIEVEALQTFENGRLVRQDIPDGVFSGLFNTYEYSNGTRIKTCYGKDGQMYSKSVYDESTGRKIESEYYNSYTTRVTYEYSDDMATQTSYHTDGSQREYTTQIHEGSPSYYDVDFY